jgi:hypothetical protein
VYVSERVADPASARSLLLEDGGIAAAAFGEEVNVALAAFGAVVVLGWQDGVDGEDDEAGHDTGESAEASEDSGRDSIPAFIFGDAPGAESDGGDAGQVDEDYN